MTTGGIIILCIVAIVILLVALYFHYNNREIALRKESEAQLGKIETARDRMFQIIREQANVATEYTESFGRIFPDIISGRYREGGELMKWIQESNPTFDSSLYKAVQNSVEIQRTAFISAQDRMLDILKQRDTLIEQMPGTWFISNKTRIDYEPISTSDTKSVMQSRVDDYTFSFRR